MAKTTTIAKTFPELADIVTAAPAAPAVIQGGRDAAVGKLIAAAAKAAGTMLAKTKEAAKLAALQLNPEEADIMARVEAVVKLYADDFAAAGHNIRAIFKDALLLLAMPETPVTVTQGKTDIHATAAQFVEASKHAMRAAAKEVRDSIGAGRKSGGGRKAAAPKQVTPTAPAVSQDVVTRAEVDAFTAWLDAAPDYLSDAIFLPKIQARLLEAGWTIGKAVKGRKVAGKAQSASA